MKFKINMTYSAEQDLAYFQKFEQKLIINGIKTHLSRDANVLNKRRKQLRDNPLAPWRLQIGTYRVFYDFEEGNIVWVLAVGYKKHNDLFIRGRKVVL